MQIGPYSLGTPDSSHIWKGQTSQAVFTPNATPTLANSQVLVVADGVTAAFTMYRTFVLGGAQDIMQNFVTPPIILDNGSVVSSATYTIDQYGTLTFNTPPTAGHTISWVGSFYYRCRFKDDSWGSLQEDLYTYWTLEGCKFISVIL
jgi:hypothetical protein